MYYTAEAYSLNKHQLKLNSVNYNDIHVPGYVVKNSVESQLNVTDSFHLGRYIPN